jgi:hypothetical protein
MTQDEQRMLQDLADKIANTPAPPRDPEAEDFIRRHIGNRPDALYLMTQTVLIQNLALQHAQEQIQQLQRPTNALPSAGGSFLGQGAPQSRGAGYGSQYAAPPPPQYQPPQPAAPSPSVAAPSGAPSFLRGAAQTAAGVAAGAFACEGIRSLFSHPGYGGGGLFGGGGWGGGGGYAPVEETVVNNYYDEPRNDDFGRDNVDVNNYDDSGSNFDTTNVDDGGFDDGGGFDGGGGDDSNFV